MIFDMGASPTDIISGMAGKGASAEEITIAVTKALIDNGLGAGDEIQQLAGIHKAITGLEGKMQKWTLIFNDGTVTGADTSTAHVTSDTGVDEKIEFPTPDSMFAGGEAFAKPDALAEPGAVYMAPDGSFYTRSGQEDKKWRQF